MQISALTRSVVKRNYAIISPDGYVNSSVPGWDNCTVHVLMDERMGANLCQTLVSMNEASELVGKTTISQLFIYLIEGCCTATVGRETNYITTGQFIYIPINTPYQFNGQQAGTQLLIFQKVYQPIPNYDVPPVIFGDAANVDGPTYLGDPALRLQMLLPNTLSFDMAVNIFTYDPGGHLPFVETHIMEHGLTFLQGQGIYRLDQDWHPIKAGDSIWMAPYCQQWFTAIGKEPAVYIYFKNINRFPMAV